MPRSIVFGIGPALLLAIAATPPILAQSPNLAEFKIHIAEPAYSGLPVWIQAELPEALAAHHPYSSDPGSFGPNKIELKRDGQDLAPTTFPIAPSGGGILDGWIAPPNSPQNRLPLHLKYTLDMPGRYSVRWTVVRHVLSALTPPVSEIVVAKSDWLTFELRPSTSDQRESWLRQEVLIISTDPGLVAGDILPSLMALSPERRVLRAVMDQVYSTSEVVSAYAIGCAYRFPDRDLHTQTMEFIHERGPVERLAYFISWRQDLFKDDTVDLVRSVTPYLGATHDDRVIGALKTLIFITPHGNSGVLAYPESRMMAEKAVLAAAPDLLKRDQEVTNALAVFIGGIKTDSSRSLLWQLANSPEANNEQARIALTWIANPEDLPRLAEFLFASGDKDTLGRDRATLGYSLLHSYGDSAIPYLEKAVTDSPYAFVRLQSAEELASRGSAVGFRFFLDTVNQSPFYKAEAIHWLQEQFPRYLSPSSDDAAVVAFLKSRLKL